MSASRQPSNDTNPARGRERAKPLLSVVLLSTGSRADLDHATNILLPLLRTSRGQLVVVREESLPAHFQAHVEAGHITFVRVSRGSTRAAMAQSAMPLVRGDIVAIREDVAVRDAEWLAPYRHALHIDEVIADRSPAVRGLDVPSDHTALPQVASAGGATLLEGTAGA